MFAWMIRRLVQRFGATSVPEDAGTLTIFRLEADARVFRVASGRRVFVAKKGERLFSTTAGRVYPVGGQQRVFKVEREGEPC